MFGLKNFFSLFGSFSSTKKRRTRQKKHYKRHTKRRHSMRGG